MKAQSNPDPAVRVNDRCGDAVIFPIDVERATGILTIHEPCDPPCPRKAAAQAWLDEEGF